MNWLAETGTWIVSGDNAITAAQVFASLVTAGATIALWRVTKVLAVETKVLSKATEHPFVVCALESSDVEPGFMDLKLRNTGNSTAFNIKLMIKPGILRLKHEQSEIPEETAFDASLLPPGQALTIQAAKGSDIHGSKFTANVSWASRPQSEEREEICYEFRAVDGFMGGVRVKSIHHVAEELKKIREGIGS